MTGAQKVALSEPCMRQGIIGLAGDGQTEPGTITRPRKAVNAFCLGQPETSSTVYADARQKRKAASHLRHVGLLSHTPSPCSGDWRSSVYAASPVKVGDIVVCGPERRKVSKLEAKYSSVHLYGPKLRTNGQWGSRESYIGIPAEKDYRYGWRKEEVHVQP